MDIVIDWWTLSYLNISDMNKTLQGVVDSLKPGGIFIVCLPVKLKRTSNGGPCDFGMTYYARSDYEELFMSYGF